MNHIPGVIFVVAAVILVTPFIAELWVTIRGVFRIGREGR